jgi:hypothetical protein
MEPNEMQEFSNQMKEAGEGQEPLTKISLAVSILAVLVAMVTVLGHRTHTEAVLNETRAGDTWNEYQAKKIRFDQLSVTMDLLALQPNSNAAAVEKKLDEYRSHQAKWQTELADEEHQAREFEVKVDHAEHQALRYDLGEALLQTAVVMCSITLFTRRKLYFFAGLTVGLAGVLCAASVLTIH